MALRKPKFGNTWKAAFGFIKHRNKSGQLRTARRSVATILDGFQMNTEANTLADMLAFRTAFLAAAGTQTTYTDFEGHTWTGHWIPESLQIKRGRAGCNYELTFAFEGSFA